MYNDHKTAADRLARSSRSLELSRRTLVILSMLAIAAFIMAGRADAQALALGWIS